MGRVTLLPAGSSAAARRETGSSAAARRETGSSAAARRETGSSWGIYPK